MQNLSKLLEIMKTLRDPNGGCPWDLKQDHQSIALYAVEEAYEVVDAIEEGDMQSLKEELGDLLLQVVFHAQMAKEAGAFDFEDVVESINTKMITRHPHVFEKESNLSAEDVARQWEDIKDAGKNNKQFLDDVPKAFPALMKAYKIGKRCARVGFDWDTPEAIFEKIEEEWHEFQQAVANQDAQNMEEEIGDALFVIAQYVRKVGFNPEHALEKANQKFIKRLHGVQAIAESQGKTMQDCSVEELESFWEQVKKENA